MQQDPNPDLVEHLRVAERSRSALTAAGVDVRGWEPYCLAFMEPDLLRRELARGGPPDPQLARRIQELRKESDPLLGKLRELIPPTSLAAREEDLRDMMLGFIAGSAAARTAAARWVADPVRYTGEAVERLTTIETFVDRCRAALRTASPAKPVAQSGRSRIALSWPAVPGALRYQVQRAETSGGPYTLLASPEAPGCTDTGLSPGKTYYYVIIAVHKAGTSAASPEIAAAPASLLSPPEGLRAEPGDGSVRLTWSPVAGARNYRLMRSVVSGGPYSAVASPNEPHHIDAGLENGKSYHYVVRAVNDSGKGTYSPEAVGIPLASLAAPQGLQAVAGNGRVQLKWSAVAPGVTYTLKRGAAPGGPFLPIAGASGTTLTDPTVVNGTPYYYVVSAANAAGESADSAPAEAVPVAPPPAPRSLRAAAAPGRVVLDWDPAPGAVAYVVLRGESSAEPPAPVALVNVPTYADDAVVNGRSYVYAVAGRNAGGDGPPGDPVQVSPRIAPPPPPAGVVAEPADGRIALRWKPVAEAATYLVRRAPRAEGPFETVGSTETTSFIDANVANGSAYVYAVAAVNAGGESASSSAAAVAPQAAPPAPAGLRAVPAAGQVALTWEAAEGARNYLVRRALSSAGPFVLIGRTPALAFIDATGGAERPSVYVVVAVNAGGESAPSTSVAAAPLPAAPEPPASLVATAGSGVVNLAWTRSEGAFDYVVRRALLAEGPFAPVGKVPGTSFADTGVRDGTPYHYQVCALNAGGESAPSPVASAVPLSPPATPAPPKVVLDDKGVRLEWAAVAGAEAYVVRRAVAGGAADIAARLRETSWSDAAPAEGTSTSYTVAAANAAGESGPSPAVEARKQAAPSTPSGVAGSVGDGEVTVRWGPSTAADCYRIKRSTTREGPFQTVAEVKEPLWTDRSVENGKTYFYTVRAINAAGKSAYSARLRATPNPRPGAPSGLAAAPGNGEVTLAWRPVDKAAGYKVKRGMAAEGPWTSVGATRHPSWTDREAKNGELYWYAVTTVTAGVESEASAPAAARPAPDALPPTLESLPPPAVTPESLPPGVDPEKLEDLKRGEQLRSVFAETGQKFDPWELLTLLAEDGAAGRKAIASVLQLKEQARAEEFTTGAIGLFERILKVRSAHGGFVRKLREFVAGLGQEASAALEIALGFLVSASKGRQRAELWIREGEPRRREAGEFLHHAVGLARNYIAAMQDQNDG